MARGFDFLGYWFSATGVRVAVKTVDRMRAKVTRLYEQGASVGRIGDYLRRWVAWVRGGLGGGIGHVGLGFWIGLCG